MGAENLDPPPPPQPVRSPSPFSSTQAATRSAMAPGANVPRKLPDDFVEAAMRELELESEANESDKENDGPSQLMDQSMSSLSVQPRRPPRLFSSAGSRASVWKRAESEEIIGAEDSDSDDYDDCDDEDVEGGNGDDDDDGLANLEAVRLSRRRSPSPRLSMHLPTDVASPSTPAFSTRMRNMEKKDGLVVDTSTFHDDNDDYDDDYERDTNVYADASNERSRMSEQRLVENRRRYPLTTKGGYVPTHLRQQFCMIDHPHRRHVRTPEPEVEAEPAAPGRKDTDKSSTSVDKNKVTMSTSNGVAEETAPKRGFFSRLFSSFSRRRRSKKEKEKEKEATLTSTTEPPNKKWWQWEIRATYQRPFSVTTDGSVTPTPSGAHVELSIWTRAALPLSHSVMWGIPWRHGRAAESPDAFGTYDGCTRHPAGALGRWGKLTERRAYFSDRVNTGGNDWTARASVVHDDREWLERVSPEELVSMEAANTIEIYDTAHELCFLLDANTNQWWTLKDSIPESQGQWLADNVWNIVHGFDEGSWVRRSLQYRKRIE